MRQLKIIQQITYRTEESVNRYFQEVNKYPMITADEEAELTRRIKQGDKNALDKLILANLRFVISVAKQFQSRGLSFPDLINEGNIGLVKAAERFDETRGFKFISYAVWWIRQSIIQAISNNTRIVRLPINRLSSINKIAKAIPLLEQELEREPTNEEIATHLDLNIEDIEIANKIKKRQLSFDKPLTNDNNDNLNLYDIVHIDNIPAPDSNLTNESTRKNISRAVSKLSKKEALVINLFFGLNNQTVHTLHEIANILNMSTERIRQIKTNALLNLHKHLEDKLSYL